tara:strand:- start:526 stop:1740 length:1215 start_codon:yes stop_codon:yes gene_type:complete
MTTIVGGPGNNFHSGAGNVINPRATGKILPPPDWLTPSQREWWNSGTTTDADRQDLINDRNNEALLNANDGALRKKLDQYYTKISFKGVVSASNTTAYRFPKARHITDSTDYVSFEFFDYDPPFGNARGQDYTKSTEDSASGMTQLLGMYNQSVSRDSLNTKKAKDLKDIILFMPEDIGAQYGANWGGAGFGIGMQTFARAIGGAGDIGSALDNIEQDMKNLGNKIVGGAKITGYKTAANIMNKAMGGNVNANQLMSSVSGTIINPNVETLYEAPELRGFNLNFKMMASSAREGQEIGQICKQFKKAMLPKWGGGTVANTMTSGALLTVPNIVMVRFMTGGKVNPHVSQFKPCAISAVTINNTPDGAWATYMGGAPVATELSVQFKELKLIFNQEINMGDGPSY